MKKSMTGNRAKKTRARRSRESAEEAAGEARLAVNLPIDLHRQLKARAAKEGATIRDYILELLRRDGIG